MNNDPRKIEKSTKGFNTKQYIKYGVASEKVKLLRTGEVPINHFIRKLSINDPDNQKKCHCNYHNKIHHFVIMSEQNEWKNYFAGQLLSIKNTFLPLLVFKNKSISL